MTAVDVALAALYIMPCVIFFFFAKNDMLEKPDKSKEKEKEQSKENNNKNKKNNENKINIAEILKDKPVDEVYESYRFAKLKYLKVVKH